MKEEKGIQEIIDKIQEYSSKLILELGNFPKMEIGRHITTLVSGEYVEFHFRNQEDKVKFLKNISTICKTVSNLNNSAPEGIFYKTNDKIEKISQETEKISNGNYKNSSYIIDGIEPETILFNKNELIRLSQNLNVLEWKLREEEMKRSSKAQKSVFTKIPERYS